jgi:3-dehydroquinate synthase
LLTADLLAFEDVGMIIQSRSHPYSVESFSDLASALDAVSSPERAHWLVDQNLLKHHAAAFHGRLVESRAVLIDATEERKSYDAIEPVFLDLLGKGLKRDGNLVVVGGGVAQDIGCFVATVLARGIRWELVPTTLLAQADSCIGSKSSINIGSYKNQIGTFYSPHRVLLTPSVLESLSWDEIRSGVGEIIKFQLLTGEGEFRELMNDLGSLPGQPQMLTKWIYRSLQIKKGYIEEDEFDLGRRNLLNYGHTFGHAYESATHYGIPHGIAVALGILTATYVSVKLNMADRAHFEEVHAQILPWCQPYGDLLATMNVNEAIQAMRRDKKNTADGVNCILTRGFGKMEKCRVDIDGLIVPSLQAFIASELH